MALDVGLRGYTWQPPPEKDEDADLDSDDPDFPKTISAMTDRHRMLQQKRDNQQQLALEAATNGVLYLENPPLVKQIGGIALVAGWFPDSLQHLVPPWAKDLQPTYWMGKKCGKRGGVETFVAHGRADTTVPLALGKLLFKRAQKAGFSVSKLFKFAHGHGLSKRLLLELGCWIDRQVPDPDWDIRDYLGLVSVSEQEYTHLGAIESGVLPE